MAGLFAIPNTFLDVKVQLTDTPFEQLHFKLQFILALNKLGCFEDKQDVLGRINKTGISAFLFKENSSVSAGNLSRTLDFETSGLSKLSDLWLYEQQLQLRKAVLHQNLTYTFINKI